MLKKKSIEFYPLFEFKLYNTIFNVHKRIIYIITISIYYTSLPNE